MNFNTSYMLDFPQRSLKFDHDFMILDFGCGEGRYVREGRQRGMHIFGVDIPPLRNEIHLNGVHNWCSEIRQGRTEFPDHYFDLVTSNQVFEHVKNLDEALDEITRILKPNGALLTIFPSREIWREVHVGIPWLHWFPKHSRMRTSYTRYFRMFGLGKYKKDPLPMEDWIRATLDWLDGHCFYREIPEIESALKEHFSIQYLEWDYIAERLKTRKLNCLILLVRLPVLKSVAVWIYRRFGGVVKLATRREYPIAATRANAE